MTISLEKFKIPAMQKQTLCAYVALWDWLDEPIVVFFNGKRESNTGFEDDLEYIFLEEITLDIALETKGEIDVKNRVIENLEKQKQDVLAKHHMEIKKIDDKIQSLLAIEYSPANDSESDQETA